MSSHQPRPQHAVLAEKHKSVENVVVLYLVQALLGLISPAIRAVAVDVRAQRIAVHFAVEEQSEELGEDVEAVLADLDALLGNERLPPQLSIEPVVHVGEADADWPGHVFRRVFEAKR